jgi:hypothetical protein
MKASKKQNLLVPQIDETLTPTAATINARVCGLQASLGCPNFAAMKESFDY